MGENLRENEIPIKKGWAEMRITNAKRIYFLNRKLFLKLRTVLNEDPKCHVCGRKLKVGDYVVSWRTKYRTKRACLNCAREAGRLPLSFRAKAWLLTCRPFVWPWLLSNTLLGATLAGFKPAKWLLAFAITTLLLTSAHFFNSWIDYVRGFDKVEGGSKPKPYTAGSQVLPRGWLSLRTVKVSTFVLLTFAVLMLIFAPVRADIYGLFALAIFCAFAYTLWLKPKGLGEIGLFLGHGFGTTSFAYSLVNPLDPTGLAAGILLGLWAGIVYTVDQLQDVETDFAKRVKNLAYMMFKAKMRVSQLWYFLVTASFTFQFGFILLGLFPVQSLLSLLILPISHVTAILLDYHFEKGVFLALACMWLYSILMSVGILLM